MNLNKLFRNVNKYMMYGGNLGKMNKEIEAMKKEEEEKYKDKADIDGGKDCKLYDVEKRFNLYAKETGIILNWLKEDSFEKEEKKEVIEKLSDLITKLEQQRDLAAGNDSQTSRKKCFDSVYDKLNKSYMDIVEAQKEESDVEQPDIEEVNAQPDVVQPDIEEVNAQPDVEEESCDGNCVLKTFKNVSMIEQYIKNNLKSGKLTDAKDNINKIENELEEISKGNKKDFDVVKEVIAETEKWLKSPEETCDDDCISGLFEDIIEIENRFDPNNSNAQGEIEKINEKLNEISLSEKKFYAKNDSKIIKEEIKKHKKWIKEQESAIYNKGVKPIDTTSTESVESIVDNTSTESLIEPTDTINAVALPQYIIGEDQHKRECEKYLEKTATTGKPIGIFEVGGVLAILATLLAPLCGLVICVCLCLCIFFAFIKK